MPIAPSGNPIQMKKMCPKKKQLSSIYDNEAIVNLIESGMENWHGFCYYGSSKGMDL
jgi:hypothetical protein